MNTGSDQLYVVTNVFNPTNTPIRYKLYFDFVRYMKKFPLVTLITVELALGDANFVVTQSTNPNHIQLRSDDVLWYKENLNNIAFTKLPENAKYVAWIDADVEFTNQDWVDLTITALAEFKFVQLYDTCDSLGPNGEILQTDRSFIYNWIYNLASPYKRGRSGGAWAARVSSLRAIGYLIDWDIVGASDWFTVFGLTNQTTASETRLRARNAIWANKVKQEINGNVGYIPGTLLHFFHGYPVNRGYETRGRILIDNEFDVDLDIGYREDGLIYFTTDKPKLKSDIVEYFMKRHDTSGKDDATLHMITCVFNPSNYQSRYNRYFQFASYINSFSNVILYTIELAIGSQEFQVTQVNNPNHIQLRTDKALWYKENLLNICINQLPNDVEKIAWVDCDVQWDDPNWVTLTLQALDRYHIVQMFSTWQNLDINDQAQFSPADSFVKRWKNKTQVGNNVGATGLAWAARLSVIRQLGGLLDWGIVGSGDYYMAFAFIGKNRSDAAAHLDKDPSYASIITVYDTVLQPWIESANKIIQGNVGYIESNIRHFFHGEKIDRGYSWRWTILAKHQYHPNLDIGYRENGLIYIKTNKPDLYIDIENYFNYRKEHDRYTEVSI